MYREEIGNPWLNWNPYDEEILAMETEEELKRKYIELQEELFFIEEEERRKMNEQN